MPQSMALIGPEHDQEPTFNRKSDIVNIQKRSDALWVTGGESDGDNTNTTSLNLITSKLIVVTNRINLASFYVSNRNLKSTILYSGRQWSEIHDRDTDNQRKCDGWLGFVSRWKAESRNGISKQVHPPPAHVHTHPRTSQTLGCQAMWTVVIGCSVFDLWIKEGTVWDWWPWPGERMGTKKPSQFLKKSINLPLWLQAFTFTLLLTTEITKSWEAGSDCLPYCGNTGECGNNKSCRRHLSYLFIHLS